jgi:hypothetical protein
VHRGGRSLRIIPVMYITYSTITSWGKLSILQYQSAITLSPLPEIIDGSIIDKGKMNTIIKNVILLSVFATQLICHGAMTDVATGIEFPPNLGSLSLFGVGVRRKGPIKVYSVGLYGSDSAKKSLASISRSANKSKVLSSLCTTIENKLPATFLLEMNMKISGEKMASAIAESVAPRNIGGNAKDIEDLKSFILSGAKSTGGSANKGTKFQFDCMNDGLSVIVDGKKQGKVKSSTLSKAFCEVYLDDKGVSPSLKESCIVNTCKL